MSGRVRSWLDAYETRLARRAGELRGAGQGAAPVEVLAGGCRSRPEATAVERRAGVLEQLPAVDDALAAGQVSAGHVDHLARAATPLDDAGRAQLRDLQPDLIAAAGRLSVDEYRREVGRLERIGTRAPTGVGRHEEIQAVRAAVAEQFSADLRSLWGNPATQPRRGPPARVPAA